MCMKYEDEYGPCFDQMEGWVSRDKSLIYFLGQFNIHVNPEDISDVKYEVFKALELCHETGAIRPMTKEEKDKFYEEEIKQETYEQYLHAPYFCKDLIKAKEEKENG